MAKTQIIVDYWDHECFDGCCYEYGTSIRINGKEICDSDEVATAIKKVIEHLGYNAEVIQTYNGKPYKDEL